MLPAAYSSLLTPYSSLLIVACQPTVQVGLLLLVTFDAEAHLETHPFYPVHGFHCPMALGAGNLLLDMPFVVEDHVLSQVIGLSPRRGRPGIEIPMLLFDLWVIGNNVLVAIEALFHRRHTWVFGATHVGVTELTLDLLHTRMHLVAEGYGLLRAHIQNGGHVKQIQEKEDG
jgi:hypothetical protein